MKYIIIFLFPILAQGQTTNFDSLVKAGNIVTSGNSLTKNPAPKYDTIPMWLEVLDTVPKIYAQELLWEIHLKKVDTVIVAYPNSRYGKSWNVNGYEVREPVYLNPDCLNCEHWSRKHISYLDERNHELKNLIVKPFL